MVSVTQVTGFLTSKNTKAHFEFRIDQQPELTKPSDYFTAGLNLRTCIDALLGKLIKNEHIINNLINKNGAPFYGQLFQSKKGTDNKLTEYSEDSDYNTWAAASIQLATILNTSYDHAFAVKFDTYFADENMSVYTMYRSDDHIVCFNLGSDKSGEVEEICRVGYDYLSNTVTDVTTNPLSYPSGDDYIEIRVKQNLTINSQKFKFTVSGSTYSLIDSTDSSKKLDIVTRTISSIDFLVWLNPSSIFWNCSDQFSQEYYINFEPRKNKYVETVYSKI